MRPTDSSIALAHLLLAAALAVPCVALAADATPPAKPAPAPSATLVRMRVPLFADAFQSTPVARVDAEFILAEELADAVAGSHGKMTAGAKAGQKDFVPLLERLIDIRLLLVEARDSGIDESAAVKEKIQALEEQQLKDILRSRAMKGAKVEKAALDRSYDAARTEYRMHALNFTSAEDAKAVAVMMAGGAPFPEVASKLAAEKRAKDLGVGSVPASSLDPVFGPVLKRTLPGFVTSPTKVDSVWVVAQLLDVKVQDDPKLRAEVEASMLEAARQAALRAYFEELKKRYAKIDVKLYKSLDWDGPRPGAAALRKDKRVLARIQGGTTITIADLGAELERHFWHGLEEAAQKKRIGGKVDSSFDSLLFRALMKQDAVRQDLRASEAFRKPLKLASDRVVFNAFMEEVVAPSIKVPEADIKKYYDEHPAEYRSPGMVRLDGLGFQTAADAQGALARLKGGADFKWVGANADGLLKGDAQKIKFEGMPVTLASLPEGLAKALSGAREGDYRMYASPEGEAYVVQVAKEFPPGVQSFDQVRDSIRDKLFAEKVPASIKEWADKVRAHHEVEVYIVRAGE